MYLQPAKRSEGYLYLLPRVPIPVVTWLTINVKCIALVFAGDSLLQKWLFARQLERATLRAKDSAYPLCLNCRGACYRNGSQASRRCFSLSGTCPIHSQPSHTVFVSKRRSVVDASDQMLRVPIEPIERYFSRPWHAFRGRSCVLQTYHGLIASQP
jgi:hypothetical protein